MSYSCTVRVIKFDEYNPKAKGKRVQWFRLDASLFMRSDFCSISAPARLTWVWLMSQACLTTSREVSISARNMREMGSRRARQQREIVSTLSSLGWIQVLIESDGSASKPLRTYVRNVRTYVTNASAEVAEAPSPPPRKQPPNTELNRKIWNAYSEAYDTRYQKKPVRNATVNGQISQLGKRLGDDAVEVVKFYVGHNEGFYLKKVHPIGLCLQDAEALHTQWVRGRPVTSTIVRQFEKQQSTQNLLDMIDRGEIR